MNKLNKNLKLKKGDVVVCEYPSGERDTFIVDGWAGYTLKEMCEMGASAGSIKRILRPNRYKTIYESKEILDDKEKEYLSAVIKPFKDRVCYVAMGTDALDEDLRYVETSVKNESTIYLPNFKKGTMYKGMKLRKEYTLEELGLD